MYFIFYKIVSENYWQASENVFFPIVKKRDQKGWTSLLMVIDTIYVVIA